MTFVFGSWTLGAALLFSAIKNMSLLELVRGETGPGQPPSIVDSTLAMAQARKSGGTTTGGTTAPEPLTKSGIGTFDGVKVAAWMIPWLEKSREAGWKGKVTSGYRTPAYSESLCQKMCGAPSCPGKCAGRTSNHSGKVFPKGAIDVTDYVTFGKIQRRIHSPLRNDLPADPVHFSTTGH